MRGIPLAPPCPVAIPANFRARARSPLWAGDLTLGGRIIPREIKAVIGASITAVTGFFGSRADVLMPMWQSLRAALNRFGCKHKPRRTDVIDGADRTYHSIMAWFAQVRNVTRITA